MYTLIQLAEPQVLSKNALLPSLNWLVALVTTSLCEGKPDCNTPIS